MRIMLTLINIKKGKNVIEAEYYNEDEKDKLYYIKIDIISGEIVTLKKPKASIYGTAASHARRALVNLAKLDSVPPKHTVIWY